MYDEIIHLIKKGWLDTSKWTLDWDFHIKPKSNKLVKIENIDWITTDWYWELVKEPTGFSNNRTITFNYDSVARTVTLSGDFQWYYRWKKVDWLTNWWTSQAHPDTFGERFLYYNGSFVWSQTPWDFSDIQIVYVQYDWHKFALRECHWFMQRQSHKEFHETVWTYRISWWDFDDYTLNSQTPADRRPNIATLTIQDEDLLTDLPLLNTKKYTHRYITWASSREYLVQQDDIIRTNGAVAQYNYYDWANRTFANIPNNQYAAVFVVGIPVTSDVWSQEYRYVFVQPQKYWTLDAIQKLTPNDIIFGDLAVPEFVFFGKIIILTIWNNRRLYSVEILTWTRKTQITATGNFLTTVNSDDSLTWTWTASSPLSINKNRISLVTKWTAEPTEYYSDAVYTVLEYTYWTTKYYRTVYENYTTQTDIFYAEPTLVTPIASRVLSLT